MALSLKSKRQLPLPYFSRAAKLGDVIMLHVIYIMQVEGRIVIALDVLAIADLIEVDGNSNIGESVLSLEG
jgi:hypothetical protein